MHLRYVVFTRGLEVAILGGTDETVDIVSDGVQLKIGVSGGGHGDGDVVHGLGVQVQDFQVVSKFKLENGASSSCVALFGIDDELLEKSECAFSVFSSTVVNWSISERVALSESIREKTKESCHDVVGVGHNSDIVCV